MLYYHFPLLYITPPYQAEIEATNCYTQQEKSQEKNLRHALNKLGPLERLLIPIDWDKQLLVEQDR